MVRSGLRAVVSAAMCCRCWWQRRRRRRAWRIMCWRRNSGATVRWCWRNGDNGRLAVGDNHTGGAATTARRSRLAGGRCVGGGKRRRQTATAIRRLLCCGGDDSCGVAARGGDDDTTGAVGDGAMDSAVRYVANMAVTTALTNTAAAGANGKIMAAA